MFFKGSRYENVETDRFTTADGQVVRFKRVRFIPEIRANLAVAVNQGERLDHIAHRIYRTRNSSGGSAMQISRWIPTIWWRNRVG
jgi:predicted fused transcriptional regulator/phosphomethylpyrimidine kinase